MLHLHAGLSLTPRNGLAAECSCRGTAGFAHVSSWRNRRRFWPLGGLQDLSKVLLQVLARWYVVGLCEQDYHGVVRFLVGVLEDCSSTAGGNCSRRLAMQQLGNRLTADQNEDALSVREAGSYVQHINRRQHLQANCDSYPPRTEALDMYRDVYSGYLKFNGEEHEAPSRRSPNCLNATQSAINRTDQVGAA